MKLAEPVMDEEAGCYSLAFPEGEATDKFDIRLSEVSRFQTTFL